MAKYLITRVDTFRVSTEEEAKDFVEELKNGDGEVLKHSIEYKETKPTKTNPEGDYWYRLVVKRSYNIEKDPTDKYIYGEE